TVMDVFRENLGSGSSSESKPRCACGLVAKEMSSSKNGGRLFFTCSKHQTSACKFFIWADEFNPPAKSTAWTAPAGSSGHNQAPQQYSAAFMSDKQCFKCNQFGHFSSNCTSSTSNYGKSSNQNRSTSSKGSSSKSTTKRTSKSAIAMVRISKKPRPI
ncbi:hypothetical protein FBU30_002534, partial [Linnemannia zychae]